MKIKTWHTGLTQGAIRNCNVSLKDSPFHLGPFIGGTREAEAPQERLRIEFVPCPTVDMWVYGDKKLLTGNGRTAPVQAWFDAIGVTDARAIEIEITETARGVLRIRRV